MFIRMNYFKYKIIIMILFKIIILYKNIQNSTRTELRYLTKNGYKHRDNLKI